MSESESIDDQPRSIIEERIFELCQELHAEGHTRRDIVHHLREVADYHEDYWQGNDSYNLSPSEKSVVLSGDTDDHAER